MWKEFSVSSETSPIEEFMISSTKQSTFVSRVVRETSAVFGDESNICEVHHVEGILAAFFSRVVS